MRRKLLSAAAAALLTLSALTPTAAAAPRAVPVTVDGALLPGVSYLENGVTAVPLRTLLDAVGGWTVAWDRENGLAVAYQPGRTVSMRPGERVLWVNDRRHTVPAAVYVENGRTYVPVRALCQAMGWTAEWDGALGGAAVTTGIQVNGAAAEGPAWTEEDLYWLSRVISAESRGESFQGQLAVGSVVMNRVASPEFPNTIREVVFDRKDGVQFEPVSNGTVYKAPTAQAMEAARRVLAGENVIGDALYFYAPALSQGLWINANRTYCKTIGCHRFYL